ncbi:hypothetical protein FKM82_019009 [Ascaphus truei]
MALLLRQVRDTGLPLSLVISLQSMNMTLQHQLNKSQKGLESLRSNNEELLKVIDIQKDENKKFAKIIQEKEGERLKLWQQNEIAATTGKIEVEDVLGKMKDFQCKLEASGKEKEILGITLRQRDAEVSRLRELIRTLQDSMAKLLSDLSQDNAKSTSGNNLTKSLLDSYERQLQSDQCPASTSIMSYLKKLETDHVFPNTEAIFAEKPVPPKAASKMYTCCVTSDLSEDFATSKAPRDSHRDTYQRSEYICIPEKPSTDARSDSGPLTCDQFKPDETMYLPIARSPSKKQLAPSLRQMCTPPTANLEPGGYESSSAHRKHSGCGGPEESQVASDGEFGVKKVLTNASEMPGRSIKLGEGFPEMEKYPVAVFSADVVSVSCPPTLQQMKNLQIKDGDPSDHSMLDFMSGKSDWSTSSFSTFTSHDEQDFRNGLAALDANIAKLQRTLQADFSNK